MDCEGFDEAVLDLLGDDRRDGVRGRDDATVHAEGCARCAAQLASLKRTLDTIRLPELVVPPGLEARILEAARAHAAEQRPNLWRRLDRWVSFAGSYAMRPQLAMGLLLMLMTGTSLILLRARPNQRSGLMVSEHGMPAPAARKEAEAAASVANVDAPRAYEPQARAKKPDDDSRGAARSGDDSGARERGPERIKAVPATGDGSAAKGESVAVDRNSDDASPTATAAAPVAAAPPAAMPVAPAAGAFAASAPAEMPAAGNAAAPDAAFSEAMDDYKAKRFSDALRGFEVVARGTGSQAPNAAFFAARSVRYASGCGAAVTRFDDVASRYAGTGTAAEAMWDAAQCYREIGQFDRARQLYRALRSVAGYRDRVEQELAALDQRDRPPAAGAQGGNPRAAGRAVRAAPPP